MSYTDYDFPHTGFYDSDLRELIDMYKKLVPQVEGLEEWKEEHEEAYSELKDMVDKIYSGDFPPAFVTSLIGWYKNNIVSIIGEIAKQVFFGLTDDGYFIAYIPDSWSDITFGTSGLDDFPEGIDFGHLTLSY